MTQLAKNAPALICALLFGVGGCSGSNATGTVPQIPQGLRDHTDSFAVPRGCIHHHSLTPAIPRPCVTPTPSPTPTPTSAQHLYVGRSSGVDVYALPLTANSTPAVTLKGGFNTGVQVDAAGHLWVASHEPPAFNQPPAVSVYNQPISATSTPSFTISGTSAGFINPAGMAFDASGNLYLVDQYGAGTSGAAGRLFVFAPPFSSSSTPSVILTQPNNNNMFDVAINGSQLSVTEVNGTSVYALPLNSASAPAFTLSFATEDVGLAYDRSGRLFLAGVTLPNRTPEAGVIAPPISGSSTEQFTFSAGLSNPMGLAFDANGMLYACDNNNGVVAFAPPFSASSAPSVALTGQCLSIATGP